MLTNPHLCCRDTLSRRNWHFCGVKVVSQSWSEKVNVWWPKWVKQRCHWGVKRQSDASKGKERQSVKPASSERRTGVRYCMAEVASRQQYGRRGRVSCRSSYTEFLDWQNNYMFVVVHCKAFILVGLTKSDVWGPLWPNKRDDIILSQIDWLGLGQPIVLGRKRFCCNLSYIWKWNVTHKWKVFSSQLRSCGTEWPV